MPKLTFILHVGLISFSIPSFKLWIKCLLSQLDSWPRNQLYWGKSQLWPIYSQTSWILTHINIMNSYEPSDQIWTTTPQEIWSDHQKGKMVIFRVLTIEGQFLIFHLANGKLGSSMDSRTKCHHLDIITRFKRSQMHWIDIWIFQSTDQKSTVH